MVFAQCLLPTGHSVLGSHRYGLAGSRIAARQAENNARSGILSGPELSRGGDNSGLLYRDGEDTDVQGTQDAGTEITNITVGTSPEAYGEFIGPGVPRLLKEDEGTVSVLTMGAPPRQYVLQILLADHFRIESRSVVL